MPGLWENAIVNLTYLVPSQEYLFDGFGVGRKAYVEDAVEVPATETKFLCNGFEFCVVEGGVDV